MNASASSGSAAFRLKDLVVHPATGRVVGPQTEIRLEPRVMAVLEALARNAGQLVSRAELLGEIWPGSGVYDEALTQSVYQLRQQLLSVGGHGDYRNLITTVPKRGYVLKAKVDAVAEEAEVDPSVDDGGVKEKAGATRQKRSLFYGAVAVVMAVGVTWAISQWWSDSDAASGPSRAQTVAVLPFLPLAENDRDAVLELGMADTLITRLSGISELVVRPMSSVRGYVDLERDALKAGRQLGVGVVVDGSVQRSGDTVRVAARLLRVSDGTALWGDTMSGSFGDIFSVQDEICTHIADALALEFGQDERREMARGGTANAEAYERYLQGRYHLARLTPGDLRESVGHFRAAIALDPAYTQAWLGLANALFRSPIAGEAPSKEYFPLAIEAAQRSLELDPSSAEAYAMLGWIAHWYEWDWTVSEAHFQRAIELNPNDTESHLGYAHLLSTVGRYEEALAEGRRARELSPNYMAAAALEGGFLMRAGKHEEALHFMEAAREVGENLWLFRITLAGAYAANGRYEEALAEMAQASEMTGGGTWVTASQIGLLQRVGRDDEAEALYADLLKQSQERYVPPYDLAVAHRAMGDLDSALAMLERALEARDPKLVFINQTLWSPLRGQPRFDRLMQHLNLQLKRE